MEYCISLMYFTVHPILINTHGDSLCRLLNSSTRSMDPIFLVESKCQSGVGGTQVVTSWAVHPSRFFLNELPVLVWSTSIVSECGALVLWMYPAASSWFWQYFALATRSCLIPLQGSFAWFTQLTEHTSTVSDTSGEQSLRPARRVYSPMRLQMLNPVDFLTKGSFCALHGFTQPAEHTSKVNDTTDGQ